MSRRLMRAFVEGDVEQALELIDHQQCDIKWLRELPSNSSIVIPSRIIDQGRQSIRQVLAKQLAISNRALARALESIDRLEECLALERASHIETQQRVERLQQALGEKEEQLESERRARMDAEHRADQEQSRAQRHLEGSLTHLVIRS